MIKYKNWIKMFKYKKLNKNYRIIKCLKMFKYKKNKIRFVAWIFLIVDKWIKISFHQIEKLWNKMHFLACVSIFIHTSIFIQRHRVCTGIKRIVHVWCARRHTHTHVTPYTRQREREARGQGLSVHAETARSVDPVISETETVTIEKNGVPSYARSRRSVARRWTRRTIDDPDWSRGMFANRDAGIRHRLFLRRSVALGIANDDTVEQAFRICSVKRKLLIFKNMCQKRRKWSRKTVSVLENNSMSVGMFFEFALKEFRD